MSTLNTMTEESVKTDYNSIPVHYCSDCLSLRVMRMVGMEDTCYCDNCGCTCIEESSIEEWEKLYKDRYGFTYLNSEY